MSQSGQQSRGCKPTHWLLLLGVLLLTLGCGQGSDLPLASVEGRVTYAGKPLGHGTVVFTPQGGTVGPAAIGSIQADGSFSMKTAGFEGAVVGSHGVTVHCRRAFTPEEIRNHSLIIPESLIPARYSVYERSPLAFNVVEEGESGLYDIALE